MEIEPGKGIGPLIFGMRKNNVETLMGKPDTVFNDEEDNLIWLYNRTKLRLTFYADEDFRLGYLMCSDRDTTLFGNKIMGEPVAEVKAMLAPKKIDQWETERLDLTVNDFNEANWIILQSEFNEVVRIEVGALISDKDEFIWHYS